MLSAYAPLFRVPGALPFIAGTALSRTGGAMFGVAVIVMLSERRGSFGLAGAVSAVGLAVLAVAGPVIGRLVDKHGQRRVALPFVLVSAACGFTVAVLSWRDAPPGRCSSSTASPPSSPSRVRCRAPGGRTSSVTSPTGCTPR